jgi:hypothetical protein
MHYYRLGVFENGVLRKICGPKKRNVTEDWRNLRSGELQYLYCSPNITGVIKSRRLSWVGHMTHIMEKRNVYRVLEGKPEG